MLTRTLTIHCAFICTYQLVVTILVEINIVAVIHLTTRTFGSVTLDVGVAADLETVMRSTNCCWNNPDADIVASANKGGGVFYT